MEGFLFLFVGLIGFSGALHLGRRDIDDNDFNFDLEVGEGGDYSDMNAGGDYPGYPGPHVAGGVYLGRPSPDSMTEVPCKLSVHGQEYSGRINRTRSHAVCQRWDRNHQQRDPRKFPEDDISDAQNYCRNPDNEPEGPWCYTNGSDQHWEYCDVPSCPREITHITSMCKVTDLGKEYTGRTATTRSGRTCQRWDSQSPHEHSRNNAGAFPFLLEDISDAENYCRNPDNEPEGPWCYTTDSEVRWEYCAVECCIPNCINPDSLRPDQLPPIFLTPPPGQPPMFTSPPPGLPPMPFPEGGNEDQDNNENGPSDDCFSVRRGHMLSGNNHKYIREATADECALSCITESDFVCNSFDWVNPTANTPGRCMLSRVTAGDRPHDFSANGFGDYYERTGCWHGWEPHCNENGDDGDDGGEIDVGVNSFGVDGIDLIGDGGISIIGGVGGDKDDDGSGDENGENAGGDEWFSGSGDGSGSGSGGGEGDDSDNGNGGIDGGCERGWLFFRGTGNCYWFEHEYGQDWNGARDSCYRKGARLVSVETTEEMIFLDHESRSPDDHPVEIYWTGGRQLTEGDNTWVWDMGVGMRDKPIGTHLAWEDGEPNNYGGSEDYVIFAVHKYSDPGFNDFDGHHGLKYICEKDD